ncbi:MAG: peptide MFS transporter [Flammeovirgaceae bacterium]|nr:peptide MFS transporter [Flammeovirgaceae bacterium]
MNENKTFLGHPRGLATLFFTEMWERTSFYGMRAILILFMTTPAAQQGLGLDTETSAAVYGLYTAAVYLLSLPGGWLADNLIGQRRAIWYGGVLIMIGHLILAIPGDPNIFFIGLGFVAAGTGFLKPNISSIVGDLYPEGGARRDAGFSMFYMGINLGSIIGQFIIPYLGEKVNWHYGFGFAAIGMFIGLVQFKLTQGSLGKIGLRPKALDEKKEEGFNKLALGLIIAIVLIIALQIAGYIDLTTATGLAEGLGVVIVLVAIVYFASVFADASLTADERKKSFVILLLFMGSAFFWAGFEQAGSTLNLFARDFTDRMIWGYEIPAGWLQNVNPVMIVVFAPIMGALWVKLATRQMNPSTPLKFGFGLILMATGFFAMVFAAKIVAAGAQAGMQWLVLTYFMHSIGELTLSPVGLSATTKLAPKKYYSQMMGIWFVGTALGNLVAGLFAGGFDENNVSSMPDLFMKVVFFGGITGLVFVLSSRIIRKWMGDVQ